MYESLFSHNFLPPSPLKGDIFPFDGFGFIRDNVSPGGLTGGSVIRQIST